MFSVVFNNKEYNVNIIIDDSGYSREALYFNHEEINKSIQEYKDVIDYFKKGEVE
jgi:hypothetical protein